MKIAFSNFLKEMNELDLIIEQIDSLSNAPKFLKVRGATSKSMIIVSCGLFEKFLRESFKEYIEEVNKLSIPRKYFKGVLWERNKKNTLEVLRLIDEGKINADYKKIVMDYSSSFKEDKRKYKPLLIKEAFSFVKNNPGRKTIKNMFMDIGVKDIFKERLLSTKFDNVSLISLKLTSYIELRNSFAHGILGVTIPSLFEVKDYLIFINNLVYVFNEVFSQELKSVENTFYTSCFKSACFFI